MADFRFDSHDIRSKIPPPEDAAADVPTSGTNPDPPASENQLQIVSYVTQPEPLETIAPGALGNEIDLENPPDFATVNRVHPPTDIHVRRSKRLRGFNPQIFTDDDYVQSSKLKKNMGESSKTGGVSSLVDEEFTSGDDSEDNDYILAPRKKTKSGNGTPVKELSSSDATDSNTASQSSVKVASETPAKSSHSTMETSSQSLESESDDEMTISIAEFLEKLKHDKAVSPENSPVKESDDSSESKYSTESLSSSDPEDHADVVSDDDNILDDTDLEAYNLGNSFSYAFYTEEALSNWHAYAHRNLIIERNIDLDTYEHYNMCAFLQVRNLMTTVTNILPHAPRVVLEFYANLTDAVKNQRSLKFGKIFLRNCLYNFNPVVINELLGTTSVAEEGILPEIHEITHTITGGLILKFPAHPKKLPASQLTSFYSVLHKTAVRNWVPSSNTTIVTQFQAKILYTIGTGSTFDVGKMVFKLILQVAHGRSKSVSLPFPSLIYALLQSQGFQKDELDEVSEVPDNLKIAPALLKGQRKKDLPWINPDVAPNVANISDPPIPKFVTFSTALLQHQIDFSLAQIAQAEAQIAHHKSWIDTCRVLMDLSEPIRGSSSGSGSGPAPPSTSTNTNTAADDAE